MADVLTSGRGHLIGIGSTIKMSFPEQAGSSQQSGSSQTSISFKEFQALQRKNGVEGRAVYTYVQLHEP